MLKRKSFQRKKVNCFCRCTPDNGVISLYPPMLERAMKRAIYQIYTSRSTGVIAATAVRAGELFEHNGHVLKAITIYRTAINTIWRIDRDRAEDYYNFGPVWPNPHARPWSARINDADALEVAEKLDALYLRIHLSGYAHQQRRVRVDYELLFRCVYSACL